MTQGTMNRGLSTRDLVNEAKKLASQGYLQEALDMTSGIQHQQVQTWRNGLQAQLAQQKIASRQRDGRKQRAFLAIAVTLIAVLIIGAIVILGHSNVEAEAKSVNYTVLVTNTPTPDVEGTSVVATGQARNLSYMQNTRATEIAKGTPCFSDCPNGYVIVTLTPDN